MTQKQRRCGCFFLLMCTMLFNGGCMGMMMRSSMVGNQGTYTELKASLPAISEGQGRLFVYMLDGGPSLMNTAGTIGEAITIDDAVHFASGKSFFYVDLDTGTHQLTANQTITGMIKKTYRKGTNAVNFELANGQTKFLRIDMKGLTYNPKFSSFHPKLIESNEEAESEIKNLTVNTVHEVGGMTDKKVKIGDTFI